MSTNDFDRHAPRRAASDNPAGWGDETTASITNSVAPVVTFDPPDSLSDSSDAQPDLSIVTVTYGVSTAQPRMWRALGEAADDIAAAEAIVVDNSHPLWGHAGGDLVTICTRGVSLLRPAENLGFGAGNNLAVDRSRAEIICLLNPDVIVAPGDLTRLVGVAREHPDDVIAPVLVNEDGTVQEMGGRISRDGTTRPIVTDDVEADYASAACWVMHRELYVELGGFDPIFYPAYYEDVDFALRLRERGGRILIDHTTRVVHAWAQHHLRLAPDTRPQHRLLRERWADELAGFPALRKPRVTSGRSRKRRSPSTPSR